MNAWTFGDRTNGGIRQMVVVALLTAAVLLASALLFAANGPVGAVVEGPTWQVIDEGVEGSDELDRLGDHVSLSDDGSRFAVSVTGVQVGGQVVGAVRVFELTDLGEWAQLGSDIIGANTNDSPSSVSLSADGARVAIGSESSNRGETLGGLVRVFELNMDGEWERVGQELTGNQADFLGRQVSLSADGRRLAIGAGSNAGFVAIYELSSDGQWQQLGANISFEFPEGDSTGRAASLSADGDRVALTANRRNELNVVLVFDFDGSEWSEVAAVYADAVEDAFGRVVHLSADGSRLAISNPPTEDGDHSGFAQVYQLAADGAAQQLGANIGTGEGVSAAFGGFAFSNDGSTVALRGTRTVTVDGFSSSTVFVGVFAFDEGTWSRQGNEVEGSSGNFAASLSLSSAGSSLAIGTPSTSSSERLTGEATVFNLVNPVVVEPPAVCVDDGFEPNNDQASAAPLTLGTEVSGQVCAGDNGEDWYSFDVEVGDRIDVELLFTHADGDLDLTVHEPDGFPIAGDLEVADNVTLDGVPVTVGGTWAVRVVGFGDTENSYRLTVSESAPSPDDGVPFTVRARGETGEERMEIRVSGAVLAEFEVTEDFADYDVRVPAGTAIGDIEVAFVNDAVRGDFDRNLFVDYVEVGDARFETEADSTLSTGTFNRGTGCDPSSVTTSEKLHCNGAFTYAADAGADPVEPPAAGRGDFVVRAYGETGDEEFEVRVEGVVVAEFDASRSVADYEVRLADDVRLGDIEVVFVNDAVRGDYDRNLVVDLVGLNGIWFETENALTTSTGTFNRGTGCAPSSVTTSEKLHCNGAFAYDEAGATPADGVDPDPIEPVDPPPAAPALVVRAYGDTGDELLEVRLAGVVLGEFEVTTSPADYEVELGVGAVIGGSGIPIDELEIAFTNDAVRGDYDRNLIVDYIEIDGTRYDTRAEATTSTGTFNSGTRCAPSSVTVSETLNCDGHFTYSYASIVGI